MNIVEAYIKFKGQLLIFISGLSGCGKTELAKNIAEDFKLKIIDQHDYFLKDYNEKVTLQSGDEIINYYTDSALDWVIFNKDIDENKENGLIVIGHSLRDDLINSKPDYHIHITIAKQVCMEKRRVFLTENKEQYEEEFNQIDKPIEKLKMNQLIYPYYLESTKNSKVNKFINVNTINNDQTYDIAFDALIEFVNQYLYNNEQQTQTPKVTRDSKNNKIKLELLDEPKYLYDKEIDMVKKYNDYDDDENKKGPIKFVEIPPAPFNKSPFKFLDI